MKKYMMLALLLILLPLACTDVTRKTVPDKANQYIEIEFAFNPEHYPWLLGTKYPQIAIWIALANGDVATIFVTENAGENDWFGADERPASLPVWFGIQKQEKNPEIDAISAATPSGETHKILWQLPEEIRNQEITLFVEANVSFDYNAYYRKDATEDSPGFSDVNGQPSIIWEARFTTDEISKEIDPTPIGHGHVLGHDHRIDADMSRVTTAAELFNYIRIFYHPKATSS